MLWMLTVCDVVDLPQVKKPIGSKWAFKITLKANGQIERYKARLVVKGYNQKYGIDYMEIFSTVIKMPIARCILALATYKSWKIFQLDVNNAFLHGDLHQEVCMKLPEGIPNPRNQVCKLKKSIYGLKQASRQWFAKLVEPLFFYGFTQSKNDYSLFIKHNRSLITIVNAYVDDMIIAGNDLSSINALKQHLDAA